MRKGKALPRRVQRGRARLSAGRHQAVEDDLRYWAWPFGCAGPAGVIFAAAFAAKINSCLVVAAAADEMPAMRQPGAAAIAPAVRAIIIDGADPDSGAREI